MTFAIIGSECAPGILDGRPAATPSAASLNSAETEFLRILAGHLGALCMGPDLHHVPGRLRLRADALKKDPATLAAICREFAAVPGVCSATPNQLTGSIVIDYDRFALRPDALCVGLQPYRPVADDEGAGLPSWAEHLGVKVIEWLLENLAVALIAAVV